MNKIQKIGYISGAIVGSACGCAIYMALKNMTSDEVNRLSDYIATDYLQYNETWKTLLFRFYRANINAGCYLTGTVMGTLISVFVYGISISTLKDIVRIINKFQKN